MFHVTTQSAASKIAQEGFCVKLVKNLAFGRGVNLYRKIDSVHEHLGRYDDRREIVLLVCQVLVGLAHENSSNLDEIVYRNGAGFSKPRYYRPRKGFDSMHSDDEEKSIWVIPSKNRVYPSYLVTYLWPER